MSRCLAHFVALPKSFFKPRRGPNHVIGYLMSETHTSFTTFDSLGLDPRLAQGIRDAGFVNCTPIQAQTLPIGLAGHDVAGQAQTGTGKTAAFLISLYQTLLKHPAS